MMISLFAVLLFIQACTSNTIKFQNTGIASDIDGAWVRDSCTCRSGEDIMANVQATGILFINGDSLIQHLTGRWKNTTSTNYCSLLEEAKVNRTGPITLNIETVSEKVFAPNNQDCILSELNLKSRTWNILSIGKTDLKFESSSGCKDGPLICIYRHLDH